MTESTARQTTRAAQVWAKIDQSGGPNACWPWTGGTDGNGYGLAYIGGPRWRIHRWVLTQTDGPLAEHEVARHTCDNPPCCNPAHLVRGTHADNALDRVLRGRSVTGKAHWTASHPEFFAGERNAAAQLTAEQVLTIRALHASGTTQTALAAAFGLSQGHVSNIVLRRKWAHLKE